MKGRALVLGDNISTDEIIPGRFCRSPNLGEHCLEGLNISIKNQSEFHDIDGNSSHFLLHHGINPNAIKNQSEFHDIDGNSSHYYGIAKAIPYVPRKSQGDFRRILLHHGINSNAIKKYRFIVAGENFGCGSSREQAVLALKNAGITCILSKSFARIFYRNAVNNALPLLKYKNLNVKNNDVLDVTIRTGRIKNLSAGDSFQAEKIPSFAMKIIKSGGIIRYYKKRMGDL